LIVSLLERLVIGKVRAYELEQAVEIRWGEWDKRTERLNKFGTN